MLESKSNLKDSEIESNHTDDQIFELAKRESFSVLTVDKELKKRLFESCIKVIEVSKNNHFKIIENL